MILSRFEIGALAWVLGCASTPSGAGTGALDAGSGGDAASVPGDAGLLRIDLSQTSVSGLSSGGFMAVQFHVAFSSIMKGAAVFAGGPFDCAQGALTTALTQCQYATSAPAVPPLVDITHAWASSGFIDDPANLSSQRVFLFGGADDTTVNPTVMDALNAYYQAFVAPTAITYDSRHPMTSHTMPTLDYGSDCDQSIAPWLGKCNYDGAGKALAQIYGTLVAPAVAASGSFVAIAQGDFVASPASHSLADTAYAYVPLSCRRGDACRVHVVFHGCGQEATGVVGTAFTHNAGYNEWADSNHLVILYPQTIASSVAPNNPEACWDWWGYDSPDYAKKTGPQMAMVRAMIDSLAGVGTDGG